MTQLSPGHRSEKLIDTRLRVIQWNIWWRFGARWRERQPLILNVLRHMDADIVTLQEVWGDDSGNQAAEFARELGYASVYAPASSGARALETRYCRAGRSGRMNRYRCRPCRARTAAGTAAQFRRALRVRGVPSASVRHI
jgi:endonuclease/exonuclease/phosphatase family metal-dependent hydrolase